MGCSLPGILFCACNISGSGQKRAWKHSQEPSKTLCEIHNFVDHLHLEGMKRREAVFSGIWDSSIQARGAPVSPLLQDFTSAAIRRDSQYAFYGHGEHSALVKGAGGSMQSVLDCPSAARTT